MFAHIKKSWTVTHEYECNCTVCQELIFPSEFSSKPSLWCLDGAVQYAECSLVFHLHKMWLNRKTNKVCFNASSTLLNLRWPTLPLFTVHVQCDDAVGQLSDPCCAVPCVRWHRTCCEDTDWVRSKQTSLNYNGAGDREIKRNRTR